MYGYHRVAICFFCYLLIQSLRSHTSTYQAHIIKYMHVCEFNPTLPAQEQLTTRCAATGRVGMSTWFGWNSRQLFVRTFFYSILYSEYNNTAAAIVLTLTHRRNNAVCVVTGQTPITAVDDYLRNNAWRKQIVCTSDQLKSEISCCMSSWVTNH